MNNIVLKAVNAAWSKIQQLYKRYPKQVEREGIPLRTYLATNIGCCYSAVTDTGCGYSAVTDTGCYYSAVTDTGCYYSAVTDTGCGYSAVTNIASHKVSDCIYM